MLTNIPQPGQSLNVTQVPVLTNFQVIDAAFSINHIPYNDGSGYQGMHGFVNIVLQGSIPAVVTLPTSATQVGLYCDTDANSTLNELYFQRSSGLAGTGFPMTAGLQPGVNNGWSYLPSGFIIKWGVAVLTSAVAFTIPNGATDGPSFQPYTVILTQATGTPVAFIAVVGGADTITATYAGAAVSFNYFAIGI